MLHLLHCVVLVTFAREKKKENHCSSRLSRSRFTLSRAYESCLACQRLFLTMIAHDDSLRMGLDGSLRIGSDGSLRIGLDDSLRISLALTR